MEDTEFDKDKIVKYWIELIKTKRLWIKELAKQ